MNVGEALELARETRGALKRADDAIDKLTSAGVQKPSVLDTMVEPTLRLREHLLEDLQALEAIAAGLQDVN